MKTPSDLYAARCASELHPIKIGASSQPTRRVKTITCPTCGAPARRLVLHIADAGHAEAYLHRALYRHHYWHEWFHPCTEVLAMLDELRAIGDPASVIAAARSAADIGGAPAQWHPTYNRFAKAVV